MFNAPSSFPVAAGRDVAFSASGYASDGSYVISCSDATSVDASKLMVVRSDCFFTVSVLASAEAGDTSFTVPLMSTGGDSHSASFTIAIGPVSDISFSAPTTPLSVPSGNFRHFDVSGYASDGNYGITCRYQTPLHPLISRVNALAPGTTTPTGTASGCLVTVYAGNTAGSASLSVIYNSTGGDEMTGVVPISVVSSSALTFTPPTRLGLRVGRTIAINARLYARDGINAITCSDAEDLEAKITNITRDGCVYRVTVGNTAGATHFTVPYRSSSGAQLRGRIQLTIGEASSDIDFTAPIGINMAANDFITIDAASYATDGRHSITCGEVSVGHALITTTQTQITATQSSCSVDVRSLGTTGTATFTVPLRSSGGDTHDAEFTILIGAVPTLGSSCADGTFVDVTANPRVPGTNNDLVEDCWSLVAAQHHWATVAANNGLSSSFLRNWGTGTPDQRKIDMWEGITVANGRVTAIDIGRTSMEGSVSGTIPTELANLGALTALGISGHQLTGAIPAALGSLTSLTSLDLSGNSLSGEIPSQLASLTALTSLDLSGNALSGEIPTQLGSLTALTQFYLNSNQLTGTIPTQLGSLTALTHLFLGGNQLTGSVPAQFASLTALDSLGICANYLTGALPTALRTGVTLLGYATADGYDPIACQTASDIQYEAPTGLTVARSNMLTIDASDYATDGRYTISCSDPTGISASLA